MVNLDLYLQIADDSVWLQLQTMSDVRRVGIHCCCRFSSEKQSGQLIDIISKLDFFLKTNWSVIRKIWQDRESQQSCMIRKTKRISVQMGKGCVLRSVWFIKQTISYVSTCYGRHKIPLKYIHFIVPSRYCTDICGEKPILILIFHIMQKNNFRCYGHYSSKNIRWSKTDSLLILRASNEPPLVLAGLRSLFFVA